MKNVSFGKEEDYPMPKKKEYDLNDDNDLDLDDCEEKIENDKSKNDELSHKKKEENKLNDNNNIFNSSSEEEDVDSDKINSDNEEELKKTQHKNRKNNIEKKEKERKRKDKEKNDSSEEDERKEEKEEKRVKSEEEEDEKNRKRKLRNKNPKTTNKEEEIDKIIKINKEKEKQLLKSIEDKENASREKILLADEINFKSSPTRIIQTNEFGFIIKKDGKNQDNNSNLNQSNRTLELLQVNARMEKWNYMINNYNEFYNKQFNKLKSRTRKGIPDCFRSKVWQLFAKYNKFYIKNKFKELDSAEIDEDLDITIIKDLDRTFPNSYFFKDKYGTGQRKLYRVLSNYAKYNKETGYVQGMGFIVALFLTYMDEESSFFLLDSLLKNYNLEGFFLPNFPKLKGTFYVFLNLLKKYMPKVYTLFKKEGLVPSMYATEWFVCVFSRNLQFNSLVRVFDVFLLEGYKIVYRIALAFIKINENKFFEKNGGLAYLMEVFKTLCDDIEPDLLIKTAFGFSLSRKTINQLEKEYETIKDNENNEFVQQL